MAVPDDTALKALINSNIPDANPGLPRRATATFVRAALFTLIDWVKTAINGNLSTWYKLGTTNTPATNAEDVYRTGRVFVGKSTDDGSGAALQTNTFSIYGVQFLGATEMLDPSTTDFDTLTKVGTYCFGGAATWGANCHSPGNTFSNVFIFGTLVVHRSSVGSMLQMYVDNSQNYVYHRTKWATNAWGAWVCASRPYDLQITNCLKFEASLSTKKIALYDYGSDHQFFGFGIASSVLRYQVGDVGSAHIFYAATSPATSTELVRLQGNGLADFAYNGRFKGNVTPGPGAGVEISFNAIANAGTIICYDRTAAAYKDLYVDAATLLLNSGNGGKVAIGTSTPTSLLHVKGATGHQQLRLETAYTPTSSSDANGAVGQISWDTNYFYVKTTAGWKRSALTTF